MQTYCDLIASTIASEASARHMAVLRGARCQFKDDSGLPSSKSAQGKTSFCKARGGAARCAVPVQGPLLVASSQGHLETRRTKPYFLSLTLKKVGRMLMQFDEKKVEV